MGKTATVCLVLMSDSVATKLYCYCSMAYKWSSKTDSKNPITAVNNVMSPGSAGTHVCMHACTHTLIHVYINKMIHKYNV